MTSAGSHGGFAHGRRYQLEALPRGQGHHDEWSARALEHTRRRLELGLAARLPWKRGLLATARPSYRTKALPPGFALEEFDVPGGRRRLAFREGVGRPIMILPGLYSALGEALFCDVALATSRSGRPVALLEDQLAGPTLRLARGRWTSFAEQGQQARAAARLFSARPDAVALSAGCMVALSAPAGTWHRLVGWSAVVDEGTVQRVRSSRVLRWHFRRQHARAFRQAGMEPPAMDEVFQLLFREGCAPEPSCPSLFVHAEDDPVAPAPALRRRIAEPLITSWGGHLGFGAVLGADIYSAPLLEVAPLADLAAGPPE